MGPQELRDAVYGGANAAAPQLAGGPSMEQAGNTGDAVVNAAYKTRFDAPVAQAISNAAVNQSQTNLEEAKKAQAAAEAAKEAMTDPKKYQMIPRSDGGYGFYDPSGKEISAQDYARVQGTSVAKVLSDSENPIDKGFINDYKNLQDYMTAWQNNDRKKIEAIQSQQPELKKIRDPQSLIQRFMRAYPTVYGLKGKGQDYGSAFIPSAGASDGTDYGVTGGGGIGG